MERLGLAVFGPNFTAKGLFLFSHSRDGTFFPFQFPRTDLKPTQKTRPYITTDGSSSLLIYPDRLFDATAKYLYRPIIHRKKYI